MTEEKDIRWKQRFQNYSRAYALLREALDSDRKLSQLEKEGVIETIKESYLSCFEALYFDFQKDV